MIGFSQGAAACTQILNDVLSGKLKSEYLNDVKGIVFFGCPNFPKPNNMTKEWNGQTLHVNGTNDPLTGLKGAQEHAKMFKNDTFFIYEGDHNFYNYPIVASPFKKFMQKLAK